MREFLTDSSIAKSALGGLAFFVGFALGQYNASDAVVESADALARANEIGFNRMVDQQDVIIANQLANSRRQEKMFQDLCADRADCKKLPQPARNVVNPKQSIFPQQTRD